MVIYKNATQLTAFLQQEKQQNQRIGFVPTMGALHEGHLSLINQSKKENDITVVSIFINPTQFNNPEDLKKYPVTIEKDIDKLLTGGCDILFLPANEEIYPAGAEKKSYDLGYLENILEGKYRPGHFQGVCQVVDRLLEIVLPNNLYLGQKDYQQCMVIKKLVEILNKEEEIKITISPTIREENGLAMSSRNLRLNNEQKERAAAIFEALKFIQKYSGEKNIQQLQQTAIEILKKENFEVDYVEIVDTDTLKVVSSLNKKQTITLIAASIDGVRLIDNLLLN